MHGCFADASGVIPVSPDGARLVSRAGIESSAFCEGWHGLVLLRFVTRRHLFGACSPAFRPPSQAFFTQEAIDGIVNTTFGENYR